jgi:hypothetical protein
MFRVVMFQTRTVGYILLKDKQKVERQVGTSGHDQRE